MRWDRCLVPSGQPALPQSRQAPSPLGLHTVQFPGRFPKNEFCLELDFPATTASITTWDLSAVPRRVGHARIHTACPAPEGTGLLCRHHILTQEIPHSPTHPHLLPAVLRIQEELSGNLFFSLLFVLGAYSHKTPINHPKQTVHFIFQSPSLFLSSTDPAWKPWGTAAWILCSPRSTQR